MFTPDTFLLFHHDFIGNNGTSAEAMKKEEKKKRRRIVLVLSPPSRGAYLLGRGHEVDGGVVAVVLLRQAEGELVVDEERVCRACRGSQKKKKVTQGQASAQRSGRFTRSNCDVYARSPSAHFYYGFIV